MTVWSTPYPGPVVQGFFDWIVGSSFSVAERCRWRHCCSFKNTWLMFGAIQRRDSLAVRSATFSIPWSVQGPVGVAITPRGLRVCIGSFDKYLGDAQQFGR